MRLPKLAIHVLVAAALIASTASQASASSIVLNGSLEDLNGSFVNTTCQYMTLGAGSTAIANWTVPGSTTGQLVWADSPTCDGFSASHGEFFVDLSGLGTSSPNGALEQQLAASIGQAYSFSIDFATINNGDIAVVVGSELLTLSAGSPFLVGGTSWTPYTGMFIATTSDPLLTIASASPASIVFVDNVSIEAESVAEPASSVALLGMSLATLGAYRRRLEPRIRRSKCLPDADDGRNLR